MLKKSLHFIFLLHCLSTFGFCGDNLPLNTAAVILEATAPDYNPEMVKISELVRTQTDEVRLRHRVLLARGFVELRSGDLPGALKTFEAALAAEPNSVVAMVSIAEIVYQDDTNRAQEYLTRAQKIDPDYYRLHLVQALVYQKTRNLADMLVSLNRCLELDPNQIMARKIRADYLQRMIDSPDSLRQAIDDYQRLHQVLPQQSIIWDFYIGQCYFYLKEYGRAQKYLEPLLETPWAGQAAYLLGRCKQELGEYTQALEYLGQLRGDLRAKESVAQIALIQAESSTGEERLRYLNRALEDIRGLFENQAYRANTDQYLLAGRIAFELKKFNDAAGYFSTYLEKAPHHKEVKLLLLQSILLSENPDQKKAAEDLYKECLETIPATSTVQLKMDYANYLLSTKQWDALTRQLDEIRSKTPETGQMALMEAQLFFGLNEPAKAIDAASRALSLSPQARSQIQLLVGNSFIQAGSVEQAIQRFDDSIASATDDVKPLLCLEIGEILRSSDRETEGIRFWKKALDLRPHNQALRFEIARAYLRSGSLEEAMPLFDEVAQKADDPSVKSQADTLLAYISVVEGASTVAEERYRRAIETWPTNHFALRGLAHLMADQERYQEARDLYLRAADLVEDATLLIQLGIACDKVNDVTGAELASERAAKIDPNNPEVYNFLGYMYAERGIKLDKAEELIRKALALDPDNPNITDSLGWVYYQRGEYSKAVEILEKAVSLLVDPNDEYGSSVILEHLGDAYHKLGNKEKAREFWKKAAEGEPQSKTAREKLESMGNAVPTSESAPN